ncbi:MAG: HD domain-containing protein [Candidatus Aenigmatarchaeota archaeon]
MDKFQFDTENDSVIPVAKIEGIIRQCDNRKDPVHDTGHLKRVARGAAWFVKMSGCDKEEQQVAYAAGLLHDFVRPKSEIIDHAASSAAAARKILKRLHVKKDIIEDIAAAISDHREKTKWNSVVHQSVYFADKVFELLGAIVLFRGCTWVGECRHVQKYTVLDSVSSWFSRRLKHYMPSEFPKQFRGLVKSQRTWPTFFVNAVKSDEKWAMYLAAAGFRNGAIDKLSLDKFIHQFKPITKQDAIVRDEAIAYISGKKWDEWTKFVRF